MKKSDQEIQNIIQLAVDKKKIISLVTYVISDYGEKILHTILNTILKKYSREDLMDIAYTSAKELVINASKANLKRVLFERLSLNIEDKDDYVTGMNYFSSHLSEDKIRTYAKSFKERNLPVTATFYYSPDVLNIKIKNNFKLQPEEERRIREKFDKATSFASLLDFYVEHGDHTEGAGMGLTMVGILLDQTGIDKHSFSLYSSDKYNETAAKLEIPLSPEYIPKRKAFELELAKRNINSEDLRKSFNYTYKDFPGILRKD